MLKFLKEKTEKTNNYSSITVVGECPKCGRNLLETEGFVSCEGVLSRECEFRTKKLSVIKRLMFKIFK